MFCKYCGEKIDQDSIFCSFCGRNIKETTNTNVESLRTKLNDGTYTAPNGQTYKVKDRIMYDEDGWDVGRVPDSWGRDW